MRKLFFTILLASAAASPAFAAPHDSDRDQSREDRQQAREERSQAREQRQQSVRENRVERNQQVIRQAPQNYSGRANFDGANIQRDRDAVRDARAYDRQQRIDNRNVQFQQRVDNRALRYRQPVVTQSAPATTYRPQNTTRYDGRRWSGQWNTNWRNDHRYDWRKYRDRHRSIFRLGFYYDPFGFGYSPFNIGYRLRPAYYSQNFWFDPGMYGLPYPPPGTQWVRYWNDAVLVDVYTGEVVDVIRNFFW